MGWLNWWSRRKQIYINNNATGATSQSNYQMKIAVNYAGTSDSAGNIYCNSQCKTDFSDIRFTDTDGITPLNYWIESYTTSSNAIVWIKIPTILTGSNSAYIYIYYNNPSATSISNGTNTFTFFDDFTGSSVDTIKWTGTTSGTGISVSNSIVSYVGNGTWRTMNSVNTYREGSYSLRTRASFTGETPPVNAEIGFQPVVCCNGRTIIYGNGYLSYNDSGSGQNSGVIYSNSTWYIFDILINGGTNVAFNRNGILDYNATTDVPSGNLLQSVLLGAGYLNAEIDVDWIVLRSYTNPEPTWSSTIGNEEWSNAFLMAGD